MAKEKEEDEKKGAVEGEEDDDNEDEDAEQKLASSLDPRYKLQISVETTSYDDDNDNDDDHEELEDKDDKGKGESSDKDASASGEKKHLSIAEKKRLKKQQQRVAAGLPAVPVQEPPREPKKKQQQPTAPQEKKPKGKVAKQKKKKYEQMTDEERKQLELLVRGGKKALQKQQEGEKPVQIAEGLKELMEEDAGGEFHGSRAGRRAQEKQEVLAILEEEKIQLADTQMGEEGELSTLVGNPKPEDEILYAMYVVAPWPALMHYKYKAKVVPGPANKKSKVATQAFSIFLKLAEASSPREAELIKAIPEEEVLHLLPANSRLLLGLMGGPKKGGQMKKKKGGNKRRGAQKRANRNK